MCERIGRAEFDVHFYLTQLRTDECAGCTDVITHYLERGRARGLRINTVFDPILDRKTQTSIVRACSNRKVTILHVINHLDPEIDRYVDEMIKLLGHEASFLRFHTVADEAATVSGPHSDHALCFDISNQWIDLVQFLKLSAIGRIHIHSIWRTEKYLRNLVNALAVPFDFTVHNYSTLCPDPYFRLDSAESLSSIEQWRQERLWLWKEAARFFIPSHDASLRIRKSFPNLNPILVAHPDESVLPDLSIIRISPGSRLRIGFPRGLSQHQGASIVEATIALAMEQGAPVEFVGIDLHWSNRPTEMPRTEEMPNLIWYPTQIPETYSYTLSSILSLGLPAAVTDIGALPERIGGRAWTWVKSTKWRAEDWIKFFCDIRAQNFLFSMPPNVHGVPWDLSDNYYRTSFLVHPLRNGERLNALFPQDARAT